MFPCPVCHHGNCASWEAGSPVGFQTMAEVCLQLFLPHIIFCSFCHTNVLESWKFAYLYQEGSSGMEYNHIIFVRHLSKDELATQIVLLNSFSWLFFLKTICAANSSSKKQPTILLLWYLDPLEPAWYKNLIIDAFFWYASNFLETWKIGKHQKQQCKKKLLQNIAY